MIAEHQRYKAKEKVFTKYEIGFVHSGLEDDELMDGNPEELGSKWWEYPDDDEEVSCEWINMSVNVKFEQQFPTHIK